jgi:hypothetical protein
MRREYFDCWNRIFGGKGSLDNRTAEVLAAAEASGTTPLASVLRLRAIV